MPTRKGFLQGYNAQLAVTSDHLIAAVAVSQSTRGRSHRGEEVSRGQAGERLTNVAPLVPKRLLELVHLGH